VMVSPLESVSTTPAEMDRVLALVAEYTQKLRDACDRYYLARYRRLMARLMTVIAGLCVSTIPILFTVPPFRPSLIGDDPLILVAAFSALALLVAVFLVYISVSYLPIRKHRYDVRQLASILENASDRITDAFEFDLRLTEAEAALRVYRSL
jgi:hypothetical protein